MDYRIWFGIFWTLFCLQQCSAMSSETNMRVCIGTNGQMSVPSNRQHHYRNLRDRFTNCTHVDGNLELTWLQEPDMNLDFLQHIHEVTGYVLISHVHVKNIILPRLQIIRGRTLFKLNSNDQFSLFVSYSQMETLELPALRDILSGSVNIFNNQNLCFIETINWDEIITGPGQTAQRVYNFTFPEPACPKCDSSCMAGCWGEGEHNCQKFSKINCSPQCAQGRCFGPNPRDCCHLFCAGGCTNATQKDCFACRNFDDDGVCKHECPHMQKYNPITYLWEPNPEGKYAYGATCVRNCPEHLLRDSGACVRTCPINKTAKNGECVPCNGLCPKTCPGVGIVNSGNIDSFRDCTIIEGTLDIFDHSFNGYQHVHKNFSFGDRYIKMHPDRLEVFSTLREITGYIDIQAEHPDFTNLSYFRNLEVIGGRQLNTYFASLYIAKTSLKSLELRSLKQINSGAVVIVENKNLCFADGIDWKKIKKSALHDPMIVNNRVEDECRNDGQVCSVECTGSGCWGKTRDQCLDCAHYQFNGTCLRTCQDQPNLYSMGDKRNCGQCHSQCKRSCTGPNSENCLECANVRDGKYCVAECPVNKYARHGICVNCHATCVGCTGPRNTIGENGCKTCEKAIINDNKIERCLKKEENCPDGYYYEFVNPQEQGILKPLTGKAICRKCHPRCKRCTSYGFHSQVCSECTGYKRGEQCEDECPTDHYADEVRRECFACHDQCRDCTGPGPNNCLQCVNFKIFQGDPNNNSTSFNCTATCPTEYPYVAISKFDERYCAASKKTGFAWQLHYIVIACVVLGLMMAILFLVSMHCRQKAKIMKDTVHMTRILAGCEEEPLRISNAGANLQKLTVIKKNELNIGTMLGQGAFGEVYQGIWIPESQRIKTKIPVAIKMLTNMNEGYKASKEFLDEAYIMATVEHENILRLLAICMTDKLMLITQLMLRGSLLGYVKENKSRIGSYTLLNWSKQIAKGMAYLEDQRLVHRDLAARNVLVSNTSSIKIADFGLAKLLSNDGDCYQAADGKMPIKWLAIECIRHRKFTTKSDVWAFGVTIWELLTFGRRPYEDIPALKVPEYVEAGGRLEQPDICTADLYFTLIPCWFLEVDMRPSFNELYEKFDKFSKEPGKYIVIMNDPDNRSRKNTLNRKNLTLDLDSNVHADNLTNQKRSEAAAGRSSSQSNSLKFYSINSPNKLRENDEIDSNRQIGLGNIRLDLPLGDDDYLMPTYHNDPNGTPGYMDLIGSPACVDNPEYLLGSSPISPMSPMTPISPILPHIMHTASTSSVSSRPLHPPPTQTIGIPVANERPKEHIEPEPDREYYNDLQRELQPLQTLETTV